MQPRSELPRSAPSEGRPGCERDLCAVLGDRQGCPGEPLQPLRRIGNGRSRMTAHDIARWRHVFQGRTVLVPIPGRSWLFTLRVRIGAGWQHLTSNWQAADLVARMERGF